MATKRFHHVRTLTPEQWAQQKRERVGFFRPFDGCWHKRGQNDAPNRALATAMHLGIPVGVIVYTVEDDTPTSSQQQREAAG